MVVPINSTTPTNSSCHINHTIQSLEQPEYGLWLASPSDERYNWTEAQQETLLGCFFYGYALTVWPFGLLADMIGARYVIFFSLFASSVCGLLYPICAHLGYGYLIAIRVIQGLVQGGIFPTQTSLWGRWAPLGERTILLGITQMVALLGNVFGNSLTALICDKLGWQWAFYIYSICGIVISVVWLLYFRNYPREMKWISPKELQLIETGQSKGTCENIPLKAFPLQRVFTSPPFLAIAYTGVSGKWVAVLSRSHFTRRPLTTIL